MAETLRVDCSSLPTESWQELTPDLPINDVIPEHDELTLASRGRGFPVLDNIAPLRQTQPGIIEREVHLFDTVAAYRPANGVALSWWMGKEVHSASDTTLGIMDATGDGVRTFTRAKEAEERDRWAGPALPVQVRTQPSAVGSRHGPGGDVPGHDPAGRSNQDPLNFPIKVTYRLASLLSMSERGDGRPRRGMYAAGVSREEGKPC